MRSALRRPIAAVTAAAMLAGCVSTQASRIGTDDGRDACRTYVVQLDSTGDFYGEDILRGAAIGAGTGALAGGLIAAATGRRGSDILAGAAIGALAGGEAALELDVEPDYVAWDGVVDLATNRVGNAWNFQPLPTNTYAVTNGQVVVVPGAAQGIYRLRRE